MMSSVTQPLKVVVFGAAGQVGRAVLTALLEAGHVVRAFERSPDAWTYSESVHGPRPQDVEHVFGDISSFEAVASAVEGCDAAVHTAVYFPPSVNRSMPNYRASGTSVQDQDGADMSAVTLDRQEDGRMWTVNLKGLHNVLEAARDHRLRRVVHLGSASCEHPSGRFFDLELRRSEGSMYAIVKRLQEEMCRQHYEAHGTRIIVLRPDYIVYGALGVGRFGEALPGRYCGGDGWVDVNDLARAVLLAITRGADFDILHTVQTTFPGRRPPEATCNVARTRTELGWVPSVDLDRYRPSSPRMVDCHCHVWLGHAAGLAAGYPLHPSMEAAGATALSPPSFDAKELTGYLHAAGVSRAVLVGHSVFHGSDNRYILSCVAADPSTFRATAIVDEEAGGVHAAAQMRALLPLGATSFRICPKRDGKAFLDGERKAVWLLPEMWAEASRSGQVLCCLCDPSDLDEVSRMCSAYPRARVVIDHCARIGVGGTIQASEVDKLARLAAIHPSLHVKLSAFYALGDGRPPYSDVKPMLQQLLSAFGPLRLLWATDSPYQLSDGGGGSKPASAARSVEETDELYRASLDCVRSICPPDDPKVAAAILGGNAERLFFFDAASADPATNGRGIKRAAAPVDDDETTDNTAADNTAAHEATTLGYADVAPIAAQLRTMIAIPSVNPEQVDDPEGADAPVCKELRMAHFLAETFRRLRADEVVLDDSMTEPGRPNVYAIFRSPDTTAPWRGVDTHTDTVAIKGMESPFGGEITPDARMHGRGSCDTKATFATLIALLAAARQGGEALGCHLLIAGSVGEETGRLGASALHGFLSRRQIVLDELIVAEPTRCTPVYGHKGHVRLRFQVEGKAAHSSIPHTGHNAIVAAADLVGALSEEHERLQSNAPADGRLGLATLTPTLIEGGTGINIVPPTAAVSIDRRVVAGESARVVRAQLEQLARDRCARCKHCVRLNIFDGMKGDAIGDAFIESATSPLVSKLASWSGRDGHTVTFGTNAGLPYDESVARSVVVFGPGDIAQAHQADEWISLDELRLHRRVMHKWLFTKSD
jgi:acetylornithine deacetylase/succinyl-diaminopimelate desuccinylase-like protein/nucleoside-diphosphate-sugar epimerase/predicted TIM-barrel fold metal-dependent hydrolase